MEHAKLFEVRGRQVLAYLDHDENADNLLVTRFRVWSEAVDGPVSFTPTINSDEPLSEKAVETWEAMVLKTFPQLTAERVEAALDRAGLFDLLDKMEAADG